MFCEIFYHPEPKASIGSCDQYRVHCDFTGIITKFGTCCLNSPTEVYQFCVFSPTVKFYVKMTIFSNVLRINKFINPAKTADILVILARRSLSSKYLITSSI